MEIKIYEGKLGQETFLQTIDVTDWSTIPCKDDVIVLGDYDNETDTAYVILQVMFDTAKPGDDEVEYSLFVEKYTWE